MKTNTDISLQQALQQFPQAMQAFASEWHVQPCEYPSECGYVTVSDVLAGEYCFWVDAQSQLCASDGCEWCFWDGCEWPSG